MNKKHRNWMAAGIGLVAAVAAVGFWFTGGSPDRGMESVDKVPAVKKTAIPKSDPKNSRKVAGAPVADAKSLPVKPDENSKAAEPKKSDEPQANEKMTEADNPFPRYLEMFRNNPEALVQEFAKEAEADRVRQMEMRKKAIEELHLNAEQSAVFEQTFDDLKEAVLRLNQEEVALMQSGQMNEDLAAEGRMWEGNPIAQNRYGAAKQSLVCEAVEGLYEQLAVEGVSDADKQRLLFGCAHDTSFALEAFEPYLAVYDKVYKNFGIGDGVFSWWRRQEQKAK